MDLAELQSHCIGRTHMNAKIDSMKELIEEIKEADYHTASQVIGHIFNSLDILNKIKKENGYE